MNNQNDMLKDNISEYILDESSEKNQQNKVYPKIAGLNNLGRTYFINKGEIIAKNKQAQLQMAQKYGAEIYGIQSQQSGQQANRADSGTKDGTSTGTGSATGKSLISCTVNTFLEVPKKMLESYGGFDMFYSSLDQLDDILDDKGEENPKWRDKNAKSIKKYKELINQFDDTQGARDGSNKKVWKSICDLINTQEFMKDNDIKDTFDKVKVGYSNWKKHGMGGSGDMGNEDPAKTGSKGNDTNPNYTFRIDIQTSFDASWFKREFKSGFLNSAIMSIKTDAMARAGGGSMKGHVYTADEMLPQDKRKLDGIQWKMTNKVAKDYISLLLGWSRDKFIEPDGTVTTELKRDEEFGEEMASKALNNRGILGRLKQKIFSNQQNNNTISVVFQLADLWDGSWKVKKTNNQDTNVSNSNNPPENNTINNSKQNKNESVLIDSFDIDFSSSSTLVLEESGHRFESDRYELVKEVCEGNKDVSELIDNCLMGYKYR